MALYGSHDDDDSKIDWSPESRPKIAKLPSYTDDWLLNFHNWDQSEKQLVTNSLAAWNREIRDEQATIIEWQDSFQRNDLADFTPPMSNGMNCLMVGGDFDVYNDEDGLRRAKLPWEDVPEADITSLRVLEDSIETTNVDDDNDDDYEDDETIITVDSNSDEDEERTVGGPVVLAPGTNGGMVRTEFVSSTSSSEHPSSTIRTRDPNKPIASYDCIVDQGLMDRVLALDNSEETVRELLEEAAVAIKEFGIYVLVTKTLTEDSRRLLENHGLIAGMEWQFELDGISDETQVVSVARRFNNGTMPKVGRLSRYQP